MKVRNQWLQAVFLTQASSRTQEEHFAHDVLPGTRANGRTQPDRSGPFPLPPLLNRPGSGVPHIHGLLAVVPRKPHWKCHHWAHSLVRPLPPYPSVLLPLCTGHAGDWLLHQPCSLDSGWHPFHGEDAYLSPWLWSPDVLLHPSWGIWLCPSCCHGLWQVHGSLSSTALQPHHELAALWADDFRFFRSGIPVGAAFDHSDLPPFILWPQWNLSLLLWHACRYAPGLCRHPQARGSSLCHQCGRCGHSLAPYLPLLWLHCGHHCEDGFSPGKAQGLLHLFLPPHGGSPAVWVLYPYLPLPQLQLLPRRRPGSVCCLQLFLTSAEPLGL